MFKTLISIVLWPIWYAFFIPSLMIILLLIYIVPYQKFYIIVKPLCWLYCFFAGQWLVREGYPPPLDEQPYLYLFNHVSMFDQFMIGAFISHHITAIGAVEIFKYPVFGSVLKKYGAIPINRKILKNAIKSLGSVENAIKEGYSFIIAPEGTRTLSGEMSEFKKGPFHVAKNTNITIVPVALIGGLNAKKKSDWRLCPGILRTRFGKPINYIEYSHLSVEDISSLVKNRIQNLIEAGV